MKIPDRESIKSIAKEYQRPFWVFLLVIILAIIFWSSFTLQQKFLSSVGIVGSFIESHPLLGVLTFIGLSAASALFSFFSSVVLVPAMVIFWSESFVITLLLAGWLIGATIAYFIGLGAGRKILKKIFSFENIEYYQQQIPAKSQFGLVLLFRLAIPAEITGYTLGIIRYPFGKYILATFISELPFAVLAAYSGTAFISGKYYLFIVLVAIGALILFITARLFRKRLRANTPNRKSDNEKAKA